MEVVRAPAQNCGRSTKSTVWKISFLLLGITIALLYRSQDTELAAKLESLSEDLSAEYLKAQIQSWVEGRKQSGGEGGGGGGGGEAGDRQTVRMFESCLADNITLSTGERERDEIL